MLVGKNSQIKDRLVVADKFDGHFILNSLCMLVQAVPICAAMH